MKGWKGRTALAAAGAMMLSCSMNVAAAGVRDVFDAEYYADAYADLKEAFGNDAEALLQHYVTCGLSEGRFGSKVFDIAEYRNAYPDLDAAFGDNWDAYVNHYVTFGITEGRTVGVYGEIDLSKVNSSNEDVQKDVTEKTNGNTEESVADEVYLHLGESVDFVYFDDGAGMPVHAKATFSDLTTQAWGDVVCTSTSDASDQMWVRYNTYKYTFIAEADSSVDWRYNDGFVWSMGLYFDDEAVKVYDVRQDGDRSAYYFTLDMEGYTFPDCWYGMGWEAFDYDNSSQTFYFSMNVPVKWNSRNYATGYPPMFYQIGNFAEYLCPSYYVGNGPLIFLEAE